MKASLIIPCYNEAASLPALIERCASLTKDGSIEVILVDNGSTDASPALLAEQLPAYPGLRSVRVVQNQGYGFGILSGLNAAQGEIIGWTHADLQTDPHDLLAGLQLFEQAGPGQNLFVKGRRYGRPAADVAFTIGMSCFETLLLRQPLWDINAQPTLFRRSWYQSWQDAPHDFSLDLYAYYRARKDGLKIARFPVLFAPRVHGQSHWNINWQAKLKFIRRTVDYSLKLQK